MSKAAYWQRGESLDYKNTGVTAIEANTIVALTGRIGVVGTTINPGEVGSLHVTGVYEIAKTGASAIAMGQAVYFDGTGITDAADNGQTGGDKVDYTVAGYAAQDAAAADTTILVKLQG